MGSGLAKQRLTPVLAIAAAAPPAYVQLLRKFELLVSSVASPRFAATLGTALKAYGAPLYIVGHILQCASKGSCLLPDWCFIVACTFLSAGLLGAHRGAPLPGGIFLSGLLLLPAYIPLVVAGRRAGAPVGAPVFGAIASFWLAWLGLVQKLLHKKIITESPGLKPLHYAQMSSCCFGAASHYKRTRRRR